MNNSKKRKNYKKSIKQNNQRNNLKNTQISKKASNKQKEIKNNKIVKMNSNFESQNFIHTKKIKNIFIIVIIIFVLLLCRLGYLQFVQGSYLKELAYNQQTINQIISPKRGTIYDSTGKVLATSASVDTITINPTRIKSKDNDKTKTAELKETIAKALSDIFELNYEETLNKVNSTDQVETIAKKVEQDKVDKLKSWMKENKITVGINIDEDTKRYYPHNNVLSNVIGSCGNDNQGLAGLENEWDEVLSGTPGKIVSSKSASQQEIPNAEETYIAAENGSDLTLTIDLNIQKIVEKYLQQAVDNNSCENGGSCIVMNPKNGDILAMATYPNYDLNNAFTPNSYVAKTYSSLDVEGQNEAIYRMWSNKSISELYEPGSVFKIITSAIALEENITGTDVNNDFYCSGSENVTGIPVNCWADHPHYHQSLRQAMQNSCNPAFIQLGNRIGTQTLYKYYKAFGFFNTTGIDLPGEANSMFIPEGDVKPIERATMSFGQRFSITPLKMITAVSAIVNDGILMKPRIVKSITNTDTGVITTVETEEVRQVISTETSSKMKSIMQSVVEYGSGWRGSVTGYTVGGKTGTSEPITGREEIDGYVASFIAISPVEDTQVVLLLTLYNPPKDNHNGGTLAAPVVSQMLTEILPYLGIPSTTDESDNENLKTVIDVRNKTITEAEKKLKEAGFNAITNSTNDKNSTVVVDQVPKPGAILTENSIVMLYDQTTRTSTTVPDLTGKSAYQATTDLKNLNLNIQLEGTGTVVSQDPPKGSQVDEGSVIKVTLKQANNGHN